MDALAPQIEEAVAQAGFLAGILVARHLQRQHVGGRFHLETIDTDLDIAGRQLGVDRLGIALHDAAGDDHHAFRTHRLDRLEHRRIGVDDALGDTVMVAQIDEDELPVIALSVHPAGQADGVADILGTKLGAGMGTIAMHGVFRGVRCPKGGP